MIKEDLDRIRYRMTDRDFLENKGLSNEVGVHVFCYEPKDEMTVQSYIKRLKSEENPSYRIIERDLYELFLQLLEMCIRDRYQPGLDHPSRRDQEHTQKTVCPLQSFGRSDHSGNCHISVSYTHLDVYKRQGGKEPEVRLQGSFNFLRKEKSRRKPERLLPLE